MPSDCQPHPQSTEHGWDEHNLSQWRYFRSLSLREKLQAVVGMADVVRHLRQIRAQGGFKPTPRQADEPGATHPSPNPQAADPRLVDNRSHGLEISRGAVAQMPASEQRRVRLARIPRKVARSMAFEWEPVDQKMLEAEINRRTQPSVS